MTILEARTQSQKMVRRSNFGAIRGRPRPVSGERDLEDSAELLKESPNRSAGAFLGA